MAIAIGMSIVAIMLCISFFVIGFARKKKFNDNLTANINHEIKQFLIANNDSNYQFQNQTIELELKSKLKAAMIDQETDSYTYQESYTKRTASKDKEINAIINKFYLKDKKEHL